MDIAVNWWAILGCVVAAMVIGTVWYGPLFGKAWMNMIGLSKEGMKSMKMSVTGSMIGAAITSFLIADVLSHGIFFGDAVMSMSGVTGGLTGAFWYWLGFAVPITSSSFLFEGKSWKLWALNAGYYLVVFLVMGAIIGSF